MSPVDSQALQQVAGRLRAARRVLVTSHVRPDGDAIASVLALGLALREQGKQVQMVLADGAPAGFEHLQGWADVQPAGQGEVDLVVTVDAATQERCGEALRNYPQVHINIDHHISNTNFAEINLIDPAAVATCALLAEHFTALGLGFTPAVVDALLSGILTDTIGFRTSNMNPKAMRLAADLVEKGADLPALYERSLLRRSFAAMRYWGAGLTSLQQEPGLVWGSLTLADRQAVGYPGNDDAELINNMSMIEGARVTVLFVEQAGQHVKVSWRSQGGQDVSRIAAQFGGGGHVAAAGAVVHGSLSEAQAQVLAATRQALQE